MREEVRRITREEMAVQQGYMQRFTMLNDRPKTFSIVTYGCQMNAHDSEKLAGMFIRMGLKEAPANEAADVVLSNTCCIRDNAERKALGNVNWLKELKKENPRMLIGVCGCMVQEDGMMHTLIKQYPFVDFAFGTGNLHKMPEILYHTVKSRSRFICVSDEKSTLIEGLPIRRTDNFQAYVTVMYGCDNYCSYCIVPYVRGHERSRKADDIVRDVDGLVKDGVKEIMLLGQNVNSYGNDAQEGISFAKLLARVKQTGIERIRFMTSHPKDLSDELIEEIANNQAVLRHFHLPVQSGSDRILEKMNRRYTRKTYLSRVQALRSAVPGIGLTTDIIVGFPGETEADFLDTMSLLDKVSFDSAYTFIYSARKGTVAAQMSDHIAPDVAGERLKRLIALQEQKTAQNLASMIGKTESVLVTGTSKRSSAMVTGKGGRGFSINFYGSDKDIGCVLPVKITAAGKTTLRGEKIEGETP